MKQYVNFNYAEKVNKRSQGEIETEFLQFSTQDLKQKWKLKERAIYYYYSLMEQAFSNRAPFFTKMEVMPYIGFTK